MCDQHFQTNAMRVAVIGAGIAGLQQARALQKRGIDFVIYEADAKEYIELYARRFDLERSIKYSSPVVHIQRPAGQTSGWTVTAQVKNGKIAEHAEEFDFVILATGSFLIPRIPNIKGRESFTGKEIVARQLSNQNLHIAEGKKVVVIGSAKTALDVAGAAAEVADSVTVLARKGEFKLPSKAQQDVDVAQKLAWRYSFMPPHNFRVARLATCCQLLCDELVSDLGYSKFRKGWGLLKEVWSPYTGNDYAEVFKQKHNGNFGKDAMELTSHQNDNAAYAGKLGNGSVH